MNDVDPMSMTLEEIYDLSREHFEPQPPEYQNSRGYEFDIRYTRYGGGYLRINGKEFFTIKDDDDWEFDHVTHDPQCNMCDGTSLYGRQGVPTKEMEGYSHP